MCAITGLFDTQGQRPIDAELLARLNNLQSHRGPDDAGLHIEPGVGLAHRRLSIIDLGGGHQPLYNQDRSVVIVFNGEIYNYRELMDELTALGYPFTTRSDTEVIVHAWEAWGEACVQRLSGMFAFALWDRRREALFLARDRLGIKPLYYALLPDGQLLFASELKALAAHPKLPRALDISAVEDYFSFGYVPEPKTIYAAARKLSPGYGLSVRRGQTVGTPQRYWDVPFRPSAGNSSAADIAQELIVRLRAAVQSHLLSEVPLGAFLSGGVDSRAVVAMMAGLSDTPVNTCSIAFKVAAYNEAHHAAVVAQRYRTAHRVEEVDTDDFSLIDRLVSLYDEPYADSSAMPTYRVCELARRNVTVALSGDGGDEGFAGYRRYRLQTAQQQARGWLPLGLRVPLFGFLGRVYPRLGWAPRLLRAKTTLQEMAYDTVESYHHAISLIKSHERHPLYSARLKRELQGYDALEVFRRHAAAAPTDHPLSLIQYLDYKTYLPGDILTKVDRASMAHGLEVRVPLLDHRFVEWVSGLPPALKLKRGEGKYIFKKALEPHLPHDILYRRKMGFGVPLGEWFRGPLRERVRAALTGPMLQDTGLFDAAAIRRLLDGHQARQRDHSAELWGLLMFEGFVRAQGGLLFCVLDTLNTP